MNAIELINVSFSYKEKPILKDVTAQIPKGSFVVLLGENGTGKTTLVDIAMGFKKPSGGSAKVFGEDASGDPYELRHWIAYLSEKVDLPGDWLVGGFLRFNAHFYRDYSVELENRLIELFRIDVSRRINGLSAGELRRVQIVAALSAQPNLILIDEITAVLDITGRRKLMVLLHELRLNNQATILMATNILEDLPSYATHVLLLKSGIICQMQSMSDFLGDQGAHQFSARVAAKLEED